LHTGLVQIKSVEEKSQIEAGKSKVIFLLTVKRPPNNKLCLTSSYVYPNASCEFDIVQQVSPLSPPADEVVEEGTVLADVGAVTVNEDENIVNATTAPMASQNDESAAPRCEPSCDVHDLLKSINNNLPSGVAAYRILNDPPHTYPFNCALGAFNVDGHWIEGKFNSLAGRKIGADGCKVQFKASNNGESIHKISYDAWGSGYNTSYVMFSNEKEVELELMKTCSYCGKGGALHACTVCGRVNHDTCADSSYVDESKFTVNCASCGTHNQVEHQVEQNILCILIYHLLFTCRAFKLWLFLIFRPRVMIISLQKQMKVLSRTQLLVVHKLQKRLS
jgi:hypothetical protein